jgi:hypothetical protein
MKFSFSIKHLWWQTILCSEIANFLNPQNVGSNFTATHSTMTDEEILQAIQQVDGLEGMTVNERLFASGLINEFDKAKKHDKEKTRKILELLQADKPSIDKIIK